MKSPPIQPMNLNPDVALQPLCAGNFGRRIGCGRSSSVVVDDLSRRSVRVLQILICLVFTFAVLRADAGSMWTQLDSQNVSKQRLKFTIKTEKTGDNVRFQVSVESKESALSSFLQAHLAVFDGTNQIVSCAVEKLQQDKSVVYEFEVASKYLAQSRFTFGNMAASNGRPMPAGDFYWFYLRDFANEK